MCLGIVMTVGNTSIVETVSESVSNLIHGENAVLPLLTCNHTAQEVASFRACDIAPRDRQALSLHTYFACASASYCHSPSMMVRVLFDFSLDIWRGVEVSNK